MNLKNITFFIIITSIVIFITLFFLYSDVNFITGHAISMGIGNEYGKAEVVVDTDDKELAESSIDKFLLTIIILALITAVTRIATTRLRMKYGIKKKN